MNNEKTIELKELIKEQYSNIVGIVVLKNDRIIFENYFNGYNRNDTVHVASVTKSILSALIGIAVDKGYIKSIEQNILDYFLDYKTKRGENTIQKITIKNLLTMTAPYKYKYEPYTKVYSSDDWTKAVLDLLGGKGKIGVFKYTTVGIQLLSGIIANATGQRVLDFATENLFKPLDIKAPHNVKINNKEEHFAFLKNKDVSGWVIDPKGINTAGWGLALSTNDMAKIGQLYLNKGKWNSKRILSSKWIEDSTKEHSRWGELPYGYLWWIIDGDDNINYAALGDGGNVIFVSPGNKMVIAITSRFMPRAKDRIKLIKKNIMPIFNDDLR
ncbi:MAG: serine hydrolase [Spirochaetes bacterium GWD1_27_9]|nr:MAG: serine hydrolase [Spirochaetes bacterium GWB1_27_13]OHD26840.1 MAG: serine hydrolase [Spirochaetes bacterium GWC1_27_15]OHD38717.1 MAG: serine hydrolase [Spirochaetes bacterium GWD1_27_9]